MKKSASQKKTSPGSPPEDFLIVGIGASAGGIQALKDFFANVPAESGLAFVVILHLSPDHDSQLASVLQAVAPIPVAQVNERVKVIPNHVYVVPPNKHLEIIDGHIVVEPNISVEERRAPVDIFFRNLAETHESRAVAVVLSGTGANGSMGIKRVKEKGGVAFVQNPREAEFSEMPRNSIATELIDAVLNVAEIPAKIIAYKNNLGAVKIPIEPQTRPEDDQSALRKIFTSLRVRTGHEFSNYKRPTVLRRIERRINVRELESLSAYAAFIKENPEELTALLKDLLISVTNFFRDKQAFEWLESEIVPRILQDKPATEQIRLWVAGCATGEEPYSLAMLLVEQTESSSAARDIQIFATDIDEAAITAARDGFYSLNDAADVSPKRLRRFFIKDGNGFRIRRELREMVLFANHNLLKDPPFSHLDLVTCRNLLIYFNGTAQERAMETFHFALNPGAYLFLGMSESVDGAGDLYAPVNKEYHIFQSRQATARIAYPVPDAPHPMRFVAPKMAIAERSPETENHLLERISFGDLHRQMLEQYAPPSIVINEHYDIVHLSPRAGRFLQMAGGEPSKNLLQLIRPELQLELRTALFQAVQHRTNVVAANLNVPIDGHAEIVNIQVRPVLRREDTARGFLLVIFESSESEGEAAEKIIASDEPLVQRLGEELERVKFQLRSSVEQFELQTEELRASNEELQAMNEELRSTAEELETSREELQSVNEELLTVNQELKIKIEELSQSNNDFQNLLNSTAIGTIFLDRNLQVKMFTPNAREVFNLIDSDLNRPLADITTKLDFADLQTDVERVLETLQTIEHEISVPARSPKSKVQSPKSKVQSPKSEVRSLRSKAENQENSPFIIDHSPLKKWYLMRVFPYRTADDKISGVVVTFIDITNRKATEEAVRESEEKYRQLFNSIDEGFCIIEMIFDENERAVDFLYLETNPAYTMQTGRENVVGKTARQIAPNVEEFWLESYGEVVRTGESVRFEHEADNRCYDVFASHVGDRESRKVAVVFNNITKHKQAEKELQNLVEIRERQTRIFNTTLSSITDFAYTFDKDGRFTYSNKPLLDLLGITLEEIIGKNFHDLNYPPHLASRLQSQIQHVFETKETVRDETPFTAPADAAGFYEYILNPVFAADGAVELVAGSTRDVTERKSREATFAFLADLSQSLLPLTTEQEIVETFGEKINSLTNAAVCAFFKINTKLDEAVISSEWHQSENFSLSGKFSIPELVSNKFRQLMTAGETVVVRDIMKDSRTRDKKQLAAFGIGSFVNVPLIRGGVWKFVLGVYHSAPYDWRDDEIQLLNEAANRIWTKLERLRADEQLRESEERFSKAFNASPLALSISSLKNGKLVEVNETFITVTGYTREEVIGKTTFELGLWKNPADRETELETVRRIGQRSSAEYVFRTKSGGEIIGLLAAERLEMNGEPFALTVIQDITARKKAEEKLRESDQRLRLIINSVEDYAIITTDTEGIIDGWNPGAAKIFGYPESDISGQNIDILFTPEDRANDIPSKERRKAAKNGSADDERWYLRRDNSRFFVDGVMQPINDGKIDGFVKIVRDMTAHLNAQQTKHDKEMLQKLVTAQEDERKRIARDLHDELGQLLTALRLKLEAVRKLCEEHEHLCGKIDETQIIAKHIDAGIDFLAWELRPAALDDLGLRAALADYIREWSRYAGVTAELLGAKKIMRLGIETETNLYRIAQEAFNNVHKHAKARRVEAVLEKRDDLIVLIIEDDGKGFNPSGKINRSKGIGLIGMRERAALIGGTVEIESAPGKGTTIYVRVPVMNLKK